MILLFVSINSKSKHGGSHTTLKWCKFKLKGLGIKLIYVDIFTIAKNKQKQPQMPFIPTKIL